MTAEDKTSIVKEFRLSDLAEEFENNSRAEIERQRTLDPNFDESLYEQAIELVLRKLSHHHLRDL